MMCTQDALQCQRGRAGAEADRRRLWLLDLPAERHRDVLGAVCGLRGARARDRGRPDRRRSCSISQPLRSRPLVFLLSSYTCGMMSLAVNSRRRTRHLFVCSGHIRARGRVPRSRDPRVRRHDRPRRDPAAQRLSVRLLHACRLPRAACYCRTDLAGRDDGAGRNQGISRHRQRRLLCFALFWHALDIIWVWLFTVVYLMGVRA